MAAHLGTDELEIIEKLEHAGLRRQTATLAVVMVTREHARPEAELLDIVKQYQGLEAFGMANSAIVELKQCDWLITTESYGITLLQQHPSLADRIAEKVGKATLARELRRLRSVDEPYVNVLGSMNDRIVYESFLQLLKGAQDEVRLVMLATTPELSAAAILRERAKIGVKIQILLASPSIVSELRGSTMRETSRKAIKGWRTHAAGIASFNVRVTNDRGIIHLASSMSLDRRILRLDIYDPLKQRSLQGVLAEVRSDKGLLMNLHSIFDNLYDEAWNESIPTRMVDKVVWFVRHSWHIILTVLFFFSALILSNRPTFFAISTSVCASFFVTSCVEVWPKIRRLIFR